MTDEAVSYSGSGKVSDWLQMVKHGIHRLKSADRPKTQTIDLL